jgi:hypothetical protein
VQADVLRRIAGMLDSLADAPELAAVALDDGDQVVRLTLRLTGRQALVALVQFADQLGVEVEPIERVDDGGRVLIDHRIVLFRPDGLTVLVEAEGTEPVLESPR